MNDLKRFFSNLATASVSGQYYGMYEEPNGDYVKYVDYKKLQDKLEVSIIIKRKEKHE